MDINNNNMANFHLFTLDEYMSHRFRNEDKYENRRQISLYVAPYGDIFDTRWPNNMGHQAFSKYAYAHIDEIMKLSDDHTKIFRESICHGKDIYDISEVRKELMRKLGINPDTIDPFSLAGDVYKRNLQYDDIMCNDLGFAKVLIYPFDKIATLTLPVYSFNEKTLRSLQKSTLTTLGEFYNIPDMPDIITAAQRESALRKINVEDAIREENENNSEASSD